MNYKNPPLAFIKPSVARGPADSLRFAEHGGYNPHLAELSRDSARVFLWRNVLCLYLKASFVPTNEIASFMSLSASRVNSAARQAQKKIFRPHWYYAAPRITTPLLPTNDRDYIFTKDAIKAHRLLHSRELMTATESALSQLSGDLWVISEGLKKGTNSWITANKAVTDECPCESCRLIRADAKQPEEFAE